MLHPATDTALTALCDILTAYCAEHGLPNDLPADDLLCVVMQFPDTLDRDRHVAWLADYCDAWDNFEALGTFLSRNLK